MKRNGRSRSGVEAKRRRRRIAHKVAVRRLVALVHLYADSVVEMQRSIAPAHCPVSPYLPFSDREPAVARAWLARGGALHWKTWLRHRRSFEPAGADAAAFFDVDHPLSEGATFSNLPKAEPFTMTSEVMERALASLRRWP